MKVFGCLFFAFFTILLIGVGLIKGAMWGGEKAILKAVEIAYGDSYSIANGAVYFKAGNNRGGSGIIRNADPATFEILKYKNKKAGDTDAFGRDAKHYYHGRKVFEDAQEDEFVVLESLLEKTKRIEEYRAWEKRERERIAQEAKNES